jgi:hypothetical protein
MRPGAIIALLLLIANAACSTVAPEASATEILHVRNDSDRAVMLTIGGPLGDEPAVPVRPCGGEASVPITADSYEPDGRLMAFLALDPTGGFDIALAAHEGDPADLPGTFSGSILWSDGTLADRLPVSLSVNPDLTVSVSAGAGEAPSGACEPAY